MLVRVLFFPEIQLISFEVLYEFKKLGVKAILQDLVTGPFEYEITVALYN